MPKLLHGAAAAALSLIAGSALAQSPDAPLKGRDTAPNMPAPEQTIPDKVRPGAGGSDAGTLSDTLERDDGVITPRGDASPGMVVKPDTGTGSMPVIKPGELPGAKPGTEAR